ncbi:poly-gamma-glutamate biosynthesis protein PgsC/CapC [Natronorubrum daqingense]|uniref:Capsule biosynthesis CapC n=1 Tax=Natronorubrum daqingense TaxID=588898 RepID=A0A1N7CEZ4_9EURY|nr:poly-gamma-glutamate biosynthesis protein PgsC/CapC [Natronorubrum daqingense]APX96872.1 hypothetical protein BB347_09700 [Natronorubrum daqingense]SIR62176.1 Capsule biosynthesis CapC [Natronorubrum daqingense]
MFAAAAVTILGLVIGSIITQETGYRLGGVIVVPLLAVYSLYSFAALPLFLVSGVVAYYLVGIIRSRTLVHGRQLLVTSLLVGAIVPVGSFALFGSWNVFGSAVEIAFFGAILPGIAAYNYHKLDADQRRADVLYSAGLLAGLIAFGAAIVNPTIATQLESGIASILFAPASDIAQFRQAVRGTPGTEAVLGQLWMLFLLGAGLLVAEWANSRWGVRLGGLIAIPLLVALSLSNAWAIGVYALALVIVYATITLVNASTLVYGRALLSVGLIAAMTVGALVASIAPVVTGFTLYFVVLLAGVGAYNFHRVAPAERLASVSLSVGTFAALLVGTRLFVEPTSAGVLTEPTTVELTVLAAAISLGIYWTLTLEGRRLAVSKRHARGMFS